MTQEREAFEAWYGAHMTGPRPWVGTRCEMFSAWQARASLAQPAGVQEAPAEWLNAVKWARKLPLTGTYPLRSRDILAVEAMLAASPQAPQPEAQPADAATIAGLESAGGHLAALVDEAQVLLTELREYARALENETLGGESERGEVSLLDRVDDWLDARPATPSAQAEHTQHCASRGGTGAECDCEAQAEHTVTKETQP